MRGGAEWGGVGRRKEGSAYSLESATEIRRNKGRLPSAERRSAFLVPRIRLGRYEKEREREKGKGEGKVRGTRGPRSVTSTAGGVVV